MKSVLISIQPKWCEKIVSGKKTIEVRKTRPKIESPFKCYIYETKEKAYEDIGICGRTKDGTRYNFVHRIGKVIGEFVCDCVEDFSKWEYDYPSLLRHINLYAGTNCDFKFLDNYLKGKKKGYGWHISDLKIYDKPKDLNEFKTVCKDAYYSYEDWFCKDGYGSCAVRDKEKEYPYNEECIYFDCPSCGGESCGYEDFAYCLCNGIKSVIRAPQSWCYVEEFQEEKK